MTAHVTKNSVFDDLGFDQTEARHLKIRATLMNAIIYYIEENEMTQIEAAELFEVTQPRISNLLNGKINLFSIDTLVTMLSMVNIPVALIIDDRLAA